MKPEVLCEPDASLTFADLFHKSAFDGNWRTGQRILLVWLTGPKLIASQLSSGGDRREQ